MVCGDFVGWRVGTVSKTRLLTWQTIEKTHGGKEVGEIVRFRPSTQCIPIQK